MVGCFDDGWTDVLFLDGCDDRGSVVMVWCMVVFMSSMV